MSSTEFSDVFTFTHRVEGGNFQFLTISTAESESITLTPEHYIYANGKLVTARSIVPGDSLQLANGTNVSVVDISR